MGEESVVRTAQCSCGQLTVAVRGEPKFVATCSCRECQRSSGSVFGVSAYWHKNAVDSLSGDTVLYSRGSDRGGRVDCYFCPRCGSTVYWYNESSPDLMGVSVGNFADPAFDPPQLAVWTTTKHPWVIFPEGCRSMPEQP